MDDKTTPTSDWLALTLAFDTSARLVQHLRQATPDPYSAGSLISRFRQGKLASLTRALDGQVDEAQLRTLLDDSIQKRIDEALDWEQADDANHLIGLDHPHYSALLLDTVDAPPLLYAKGDPHLLATAALAVVGSRKASRQSLDHTYSLTASMAERGVTIVSGLARGIDAAAHKGALSVRGRTIAVAATEPESVYPKQHHALAAQIVNEGGLIITEYPLGAPTLRWYFPRRNRIISGVSLGVLVAEAGLPSGTLTTATHAINQGREVMAIPGSVQNPQARGCHHLIKQGAALIESEQDIIDAIAWPLLRNLADTSCRSTSLETGANAVSTTPDETTAERKILAALAIAPTSIDDLMTHTNSSVSELSTLMGILEIEGKVKACSGGRYTRC